MKKYYVFYEKDGSIGLEDLEVELVVRAPFEYKKLDEHMYRILSGKHKGEVFCWHALCSTKDEAQKKAMEIFDEQAKTKLIHFLTFLQLVKSDRFGERMKWR